MVGHAIQPLHVGLGVVSCYAKALVFSSSVHYNQCLKIIGS